MKVIKTAEEYEKSVELMENLVDIDPLPDTPEFEELELLSLLIETYDNQHHPINSPDPIDAIKFRMEQQGLSQGDLIPFIGLKSKVSEVLNGKRPLSLSMIRKLNAGLGIPAEVLIGESNKALPSDVHGIDWSKLPLAEMIHKGWIQFSGTLAQAKDRAEELIRSLFPLLEPPIESSQILYRRTRGENTASAADQYALLAWYWKVLAEEQLVTVENSFDASILDSSFFRDLAHLSCFEQGPLLAREYLLRHGIKLITVPHLKKSKLDGACFFNSKAEPIIAMTLRYDRIDNFWFTLFHELAHITLHLKHQDDAFFDDFSSTDDSEREKEADDFAQEQLIPQEQWEEFCESSISETELHAFAQRLKIHPAIVAGRIRKEEDNYRLFSKLLGSKKVRALFGQN